LPELAHWDEPQYYPLGASGLGIPSHGQFAVGCEGVRRLRGQHALSPIDRIPYGIPVSGLAWVVSLVRAMHFDYSFTNLDSQRLLLGHPARTTASVRTAPSRPIAPARG
jgi:hypothetical protein